MGTHNHCLMLERGYFEVMAIRMPTQHNQRWRDALARREGSSAVALQTADARAAHAWFAQHGIAASEPVDFARPVDLGGGQSREASFTTVSLPGDVTPLPMFLCQHHTPDLVWRPEYLRHPNRVTGVAGVTLVVEDVGAVGKALARAFGDEGVRVDADEALITTAAGWLRLASPNAFAQRYAHVPLDAGARPPYVAALTLLSDDLGAARGCLDGSGLPHHEGETGAVCVAPADACGALLEITR